MKCRYKKIKYLSLSYYLISFNINFNIYNLINKHQQTFFFNQLYVYFESIYFWIKDISNILTFCTKFT